MCVGPGTSILGKVHWNTPWVLGKTRCKAHELTEEQRLPKLPKRLSMAMPLRAQRRTTLVVCWIIGRRTVSRCSNLIIGLFQISVKLPHAPHKIQVMVGLMFRKATKREKDLSDLFVFLGLQPRTGSGCPPIYCRTTGNFPIHLLPPRVQRQAHQRLRRAV